MDKELGYKAAKRFADSINTPIDSIVFVGEIDGLLVYHLLRQNKGTFMGLPIYCSVNEKQNVEEINPPLLFKVMKMDAKDVRKSE